MSAPPAGICPWKLLLQLTTNNWQLTTQQSPSQYRIMQAVGCTGKMPVLPCSLTIGADRFRPDRQAIRGTPRRTLAALKTCKTINANNSDVIGRVGFAPVRMAA